MTTTYFYHLKHAKAYSEAQVAAHEAHEARVAAAAPASDKARSDKDIFNILSDIIVVCISLPL